MPGGRHASWHAPARSHAPVGYQCTWLGPQHHAALNSSTLAKHGVEDMREAVDAALAGTEARVATVQCEVRALTEALYG